MLVVLLWRLHGGVALSYLLLQLFLRSSSFSLLGPYFFFFCFCKHCFGYYRLNERHTHINTHTITVATLSFLFFVSDFLFFLSFVWLHTRIICSSNKLYITTLLLLTYTTFHVYLFVFTCAWVLSLSLVFCFFVFFVLLSWVDFPVGYPFMSLPLPFSSTTLGMNEWIFRVYVNICRIFFICVNGKYCSLLFLFVNKCTLC